MKVKFIGWCKDPKSNHDKVWGVALYHENPERQEEIQKWGWSNKPDTYAVFWGRRGKKLQKQLKDLSLPELRALISSKKHKGYVEVPYDELESVYESFKKDLFKVALSVK